MYQKKHSSIPPLHFSKPNQISKDAKNIFAWESKNSPLFLKENKINLQFSEMEKEIVFLGTNARPDSTEKELKILIGLKNLMQTKAIYPGTKLYLFYEDKQNMAKKGLAFSEEPTPLWIRPLSADSRSLRIEAGAEFSSLTLSKEVFQEKTEFQLEKSEEQSEKFTEKAFYETDAFLTLDGARWWGIDKLFSIYGGEKYQAIKSKHRLEIPGLKQGKILFLTKGDCLIWKENAWQKIENEAKTQNFPIAKVKSIYPNRLELEYWDESGFNRHTFIYAQQEQKIDQLSMNSFTKIRQRTQNSISLMWDKKHLLLKKGDWIVLGLQGWKILRTMEDMEKALIYQYDGPLLIFDGIEKKGAKAFFTGHFFNQMRTNCQTIAFPIAKRQKASAAGKKRKFLNLEAGRASGFRENAGFDAEIEKGMAPEIKLPKK